MKPLASTWPYALLYWAVFLLAYVPEYALVSRLKLAKGEPADRGSLKVILWAGSIGSFLAFAVSPIPAFLIVRGQKIWFAVGLLMLLFGSLLRRHCRKTLGKHFTGEVKAAADQPVIDRGAYRWVRHPSYTGGILMYSGTGIALTNWLSALIISVAGAAGYAYRVRVEEQALHENLGGRYQSYRRRTKRFVPFVF
jgi:protein-S-isoprenylcysteine O-methyltransferase Ste14